MKIVILTEIIIYLLLLAFILIEDPLIVTGFLVALAAGIFFAHKQLPQKVALINEAFVNNIPKVGAVAFVLSLTFPFAIDGDPYRLCYFERYYGSRPELYDRPCRPHLLGLRCL